jgi:hypothetical protein
MDFIAASLMQMLLLLTLLLILLFQPTTETFEITQLHENTYYNICVKLFTVNNTAVRHLDNSPSSDDNVRHSASHHRGGRVHNHRMSASSGDSSSTSNGGSDVNWNPPSHTESGIYEANDVEWGEDYDPVIGGDNMPTTTATTELSLRVAAVVDRRQQSSALLATAAGRLTASTSGLVESAHRLTGSGIGPPTMMSCVTASTGINSLSVALGSTFGAFLALGVIVAFVLAAKWQHVRRTRKLHLQLLQRLTDSNDSLILAAAGLDGDVMAMLAGGGTLQRVGFAGGRLHGSLGADHPGTVDGDNGEAAEMAATNHDHHRRNHRVTVNGDIEMRRLHRVSVSGSAHANGCADQKKDGDDDMDDVYGCDENNVPVDNCDDDDEGSLSSDFSADIILHTGTEFRPDDGNGDGENATGSKLVLDSATCAGSFILANDEPTGRTYSLLVPLSAVGVQPLLSAAVSGGRGGDAMMTTTGSGSGLHLVKIGGSGMTSGAPIGSGSGTGGQSIVRLKLRKHATVDYSTIMDIPDDDEWKEQSGGGTTVAEVTPASEVTSSLNRQKLDLDAQSAMPATAPVNGAGRNYQLVDGDKSGDEMMMVNGCENGVHLNNGESKIRSTGPGQSQQQQNAALAPPESAERTMSRSQSSVW